MSNQAHPSREILFTALVLLLLVGGIVRFGLALKTGLWADEIFSLAMATGHSLEHPADVAVPELGDFVEPEAALPPAEFRRYAEHQEPPAGFRRVVRAVFLSDTSPPLYYLLLNAWTRTFGTSDSALRFFSAVWGVLSLPLLWLVGRAVGGPRIAWIATALFALSPAALYYSAEGRMYSVLWFLALALAWSTLRLSTDGLRGWGVLLWCALGAAGLLTHYFFAFVWLANIGWLVLERGRLRFWQLALVTGIVIALIAPWYVQLPASLGLWRVTAGWLEVPLTTTEVLTAPFLLAWSLLSSTGIWGGSRWPARVAAAAYVVLIVIVLRRGARPLLTGPWLLPWFWLAGVVLGPVAFDLLQGTNASRIARYALAGLPAAMLLVAGAIATLSPRRQLTFVALVIILGADAIVDMLRSPAREWQPYPAVAAALDRGAEPNDVIIVHSIPSGVIGVARYLRGDTPVAPWVVQLDQRTLPSSIESLLQGKRRAVLVKIHDLGQPSPAEAWLDENATLLFADSTIIDDRWLVSETRYYRPDPPYGIPEIDGPEMHRRAAIGPETPARPVQRTGE